MGSSGLGLDGYFHGEASSSCVGWKKGCCGWALGQQACPQEVSHVQEAVLLPQWRLQCDNEVKVIGGHSRGPSRSLCTGRNPGAPQTGRGGWGSGGLVRAVDLRSAPGAGSCHLPELKRTAGKDSLGKRGAKVCEYNHVGLGSSW